MTSDEPPAKSAPVSASGHRTLRLTPVPKASLRYQVARAGIILYFFTLVVSNIFICDCAGFYGVMAVFALVALVCGTRMQKFVASALLIAAVFAFAVQFQKERASLERARESREMSEKRN